VVPSRIDETRALEASSVREARAFEGSTLIALLVYWISSLVVACAVFFGVDFVGRDRNKVHEPDRNLISHFSNWDGPDYARIATEGYDYSLDLPSRSVFFPAYPMLGRALVWATGLPVTTALLIVAHLFLAACFVLFCRYCRERLGGDADWALLAFAFWPMTLFFRMTYTESMFVFLGVLAIWGIRRRWHPLAIAAIVGAATGTRSVGVALLAPWALYVWRRSSSWQRALVLGAALFPLAIWGLAAFAAYQHFTFGDALAFAKAQDTYRMRERIELGEKAVKLLILEPIWATYVPTSDAWWGTVWGEPETDLLFSLRFWNPVYFLAAVGLILTGWRKKWLDGYELLLSAGLLLIPYITRGYDFGMGSHARFAAVCFPMYLVMGRLIAVLPGTWRFLVFALCVFFLVVFTALYSVHYPVF